MLLYKWQKKIIEREEKKLVTWNNKLKKYR